MRFYATDQVHRRSFFEHRGYNFAQYAQLGQLLYLVGRSNPSRTRLSGYPQKPGFVGCRGSQNGGEIHQDRDWLVIQLTIVDVPIVSFESQSMTAHRTAR